MTETERRDWREYRETGDVAVRNRLVERHLALVHHFAHRMRPRTGGAVEVGELVSAGTVGLLHAVSSFDPDVGSRFSTFAASRIRGAMLDEMRTQDVAPRSVRRKQRKMERARDRLAVELDRTPRHPELAEVLGVDPQQLWRWKWDVDRSRRVSLEDLLGSPSSDRGGEEPGQGMAVEERLALQSELVRLRAELSTLSDRDREVIELYDLEGWTLREIGERFGVSESRVSQIRTRALGRLREKMSDLREAA
ncbi:MAG: sigma-70 family RNA polymerase sigma factor [Candidatus Longimicrobiales bacterium M2_2A_002]